MFIDRISTYSINSLSVLQDRYHNEMQCLLLCVWLCSYGGSLSNIQRFSFIIYAFVQRSERTQCFLSLFVGGSEGGRAVAQIIGGGFAAGEGKLKVTPGLKARHDAFFLSALQLKLQSLYSSTGV